MKFKAFFTPDGLSLLDKRFLPAMEKIGRICHIFFTPTHAMLIHNLSPGAAASATISSDSGPQCIAQFDVPVLFREYRISSQSSDRIAFAVDVALLHRAVRSSISTAPAGDVQLKLVKKLPAGSQTPAPFLSFDTRGTRSAVIQDVPISKPLSRVDVDELQAALDASQDLPQTLVHVPDLPQLQSLVDRLKNVGDLLTVAITQYGDLHLQVSTTLVTVGTEFKKLKVLGARADPPPGDQNLSASTRMEMAVLRGEALSVRVSMRHLAKSLHCHLAKPDCTFYGITFQGACLMVIFQFFKLGTRSIDKSISFYCRIPVLDPGSS